MKKWIAMTLLVVMVLGMAACSTVNDSEVSVLWSGDGKVKVPNSLINAMERAMYIENVAYGHYGAEGDQTKQNQQAQEALDKGCEALMVELVDATAAQGIVDLAKAKDVPVVFFNCEVEAAVIESYAKCAQVSTDMTTLASVQGEMVADYILKNFDAMDRNDDGMIVFFPMGEFADTVAVINEKLAENGKEALAPMISEMELTVADILKTGIEDGGDMVELILTDSDEYALEALAALQGYDYNTTRLKTHCIPVFTVGADADAISFTDTSTMKAEELEVFIYNAMNLIDAGKLAGTAVEDYDAIAESAASIMVKLLEGKTVSENQVEVPFTTYGG